nr:MAG TPA: hypothetical protein [Caudoviricetes sp.]
MSEFSLRDIQIYIAYIKRPYKLNILDMLLTAPTIYTSPTIPKKSLNLPLYARFTIRSYNYLSQNVKRRRGSNF